MDARVKIDPTNIFRYLSDDEVISMANATTSLLEVVPAEIIEQRRNPADVPRVQTAHTSVITGAGSQIMKQHNQPWRKWYNTKRWQLLKQEIKLKNNYTCQQTGILLSGGRNAPNSPVVDHIIPHKGNPKLFWDPNNLQLVSKAYHDSIKQRMERSGTGHGYTDEGKPLDPDHPWNRPTP